MTEHQPPAEHEASPAGHRAVRAAIWLPGLAVATGAAAATAHGLYEVAVASRVPSGIAWLYPLITDGLALVAYAATARLSGSAARYAWAVVVVAAGLSGLAQAVYLASDETLEATPAVRFGIGAWPAVAAAVVAHLLYLLADAARAVQPAVVHPVTVHRVAVHPEAVQPVPAVQATTTDEPAGAAEQEKPTAVHGDDQDPGRPPESPQRDRAVDVARAHVAEHGRLPTVSELQDRAGVSRGTAAKALKQLRHKPQPLHLVQPQNSSRTST